MDQVSSLNNGSMTIMDVYRLCLQRAESLKDRELSGDGYLELYWIASLLEKTKEINP